MVLMNRRTLAEVIPSFVTRVVFFGTRRLEKENPGSALLLLILDLLSLLTVRRNANYTHLRAMRQIKQLHSQLG